MVEEALEASQRRQSEEIARAMSAQSEACERRLQENWQARWENAHRHLAMVLQSLDPDFDEACEKGNRPLDRLDDSGLSYLILARIRLLRQEKGGTGAGEEAIALQARNRAMEEQCATLTQAKADLEAENQKLLDAITLLKSELAAARQTEAAARSCLNAQGKQEGSARRLSGRERQEPPAWFDAWLESKDFELASQVIRAMGDCGLPLYESIRRATARQVGIPDSDSRLIQAFGSLVSPQDGHPALVEPVQKNAAEGAPDLFRLTAAGRVAYRRLAGRAPAADAYERLVKIYRSPDQANLVLQAAGVLEEAGYEIKSLGQTVDLGSGRAFRTDLYAVEPENKAMVIIQVEPAVPLDRLKQKWLALFEVSSGNLRVICEDLASQRRVQADINLALGGRTYHSYLTNLQQLKGGLRSSNGNGIWLSVR